MQTSWRKIGGIGFTALLGTLLTIAGWAVYSRNQATRSVERELAERERRDHQGAIDVRPMDAADFSAFCARVKKRNLAMGERNAASSHIEERHEEAVDPQGGIGAWEKRVEKVRWFDGGEQRELISRQTSGTMMKFAGPRQIYPLSRFAADGDYTYAYDGHEPIGTVLCVRIRFTPAGDPAGKLSGWLWADARSAEPVRFEGLVTQPPFGVRRMHMQVDYAAESSRGNQIVRVHTEVEIPLLRQTRRIRVTYTDYANGELVTNSTSRESTAR